VSIFRSIGGEKSLTFRLKRLKMLMKGLTCDSLTVCGGLMSIFPVIFEKTPTNLVLASEKRDGKKLQRRTVNFSIKLVLEREHHHLLSNFSC
jgi:hypothetical protein